jgi:NADH-quinone oxidoreductase subunit G
MEGTFTNVEGRVQRFWPAMQAPGMARPVWQILGVLLAGVAGTAAPASAADAFAWLGELRGEFAGLRWEDLGVQGRVIGDVGALSEAAGD